jgi:hypothetical protein
MAKRSAADITDQQAQEFTSLLRARGEYEHITVRAQRGHLIVYADESPVARLTPLDRDTFGLGFHRHTGRWESMPFNGSLTEMADTVVQTLAPYLESWRPTDRNSGSDH